MKSPVVKRSIVIAGHKTSVSLEDAFWKGLKDIAIARQVTLSDLVASIDTDAGTAICPRRSGCSCSITIRRRAMARRCPPRRPPREIILSPLRAPAVLRAE